MQHEIHYYLSHADGTTEHIPLVRDPGTGALIQNEDFEPPDWALLEHGKCSHCPLSQQQHRYCPVARNIAAVFAGIRPDQSHAPVTLEVRTPHRRYLAETTLQRALSSLFGLVCSLSDCPHMVPLRPMGAFHLPLASDVETLVRASAFFLLKSYLDHLESPSVKVGLENMAEVYDNLNEFNRSFVKRFRDVHTSDAAVNAMVLLDLLARDVNFELKAHLEMLAGLFQSLSGGKREVAEEQYGSW